MRGGSSGSRHNLRLSFPSLCVKCLLPPKIRDDSKMASERILVVDDEESIREIVCSMLSNAGYQTRHASSGLKALELLNSGAEFELALSDLMMAEMDGIGLLERAKELYPDMPIIMVTAVHDISVALAAIRNGAYDYLLKPFE